MIQNSQFIFSVIVVLIMKVVRTGPQVDISGSQFYFKRLCIGHIAWVARVTGILDGPFCVTIIEVPKSGYFDFLTA